MTSEAVYLTAFGLCAVSSLIGVKTYDFLSGRRLLRDFIDWLRLRRHTLSFWDERCLNNPRRSDIWVCLTTTPSRAPYLEDTLKSLMAQTWAPARIRLHIPLYSRREERPYTLPEYLKALRSVQIVRCEDYGPATKLIPALQDASPDQRLLIVDDDKLYPDSLIENMIFWSERLPDTAIGTSGWIAPDDLTDRPTTLFTNLFQRPPAPVLCSRIRTPFPVDILQGYSGYLVRPSFFDTEELLDYSGAPEAAFFVDDVWISAHCRAPRCVIPARRLCFKTWSVKTLRLYSRTSLGRVNRGDGAPVTRSNTVMIRYFRDRWMGRTSDFDAQSNFETGSH